MDNTLNEITDVLDFKAQSNVIEFDGCIEFLTRAGKVTFGPSFVINPTDYKIIFMLLVYFYHDLANTDRFGIDLRKGILLAGPVGCGKTCLMTLMRFFLASQDQYTIVSTRDVRLDYLRVDSPPSKNTRHAHSIIPRETSAQKPTVSMIWDMRPISGIMAATSTSWPKSCWAGIPWRSVIV